MQALELQQQAVELTRGGGDQSDHGVALRWLSRMLWFGGHGDAAALAGTDAVTALERLPPGPELARAYSNLAQLRMLAHDTDAAMEWGRRALELAEQFGVVETAVHALNNLGSSEVFLGRVESGRAMLEAGLRRATEAGLDDDVGRAYANLVSQAMVRRQYEEAAGYLSDGIAYCDEHDLASYGLYIRAWGAPPGGTWMIVEPNAGDAVQDNLNPVGRVYYGFSTLLCTPASLSQEVGLALGAQAGPARIRDVVMSAGFSQFRRAAETPFNLVFEARP